MKGLIKKKEKGFQRIERPDVITLCGQLLNIYFLKDLDVWPHLGLGKKNNFWVFFQNGRDILPKSNNGIYEKVFQGHNNDIMTVIAEKEVGRR